MIPESCIKKIEDMANAPKITQAFVELFQAVATEAKLGDQPSSTLVVPMFDESCNLQPGDYAPELHFVVRQIA